jgi:quercetin dioxygenase-like cupin family protein
MNIPPFPFEIINWTNIPEERHDGESAYALWQVIKVGEIRIRRMQYAPGYKADHWCKKGHIIHCIEGNMTTELDDGRHMKLEKGLTYIVGDNCEAHRTYTEDGCVLFVVD